MGPDWGGTGLEGPDLGSLRGKREVYFREVYVVYAVLLGWGSGTLELAMEQLDSGPWKPALAHSALWNWNCAAEPEEPQEPQQAAGRTQGTGSRAISWDVVGPRDISWDAVTSRGSC